MYTLTDLSVKHKMFRVPFVSKKHKYNRTTHVRTRKLNLTGMNVYASENMIKM